MKYLSTIAIAVLILIISVDAFARASDMQVKSLTGESVALSSYFEPGKWTLVMLWTTYCGTCRSQYPVVSEFHNKHKDSDAKVIGISLDGIGVIDKVRAYIHEKPMTFDSAVLDVDEFRPAYKALTEESFTGTPTYLMFDPDGALVAHVPGLITVEGVEQFIAENSP